MRLGITVTGICLIFVFTGAAFAELDARGKLAADLSARLAGSFKNSVIPERDQKRTEKCLADAMVADIPPPDAESLVAIYEKRGKYDADLVKRWLAVEKKTAPARNQQVMSQVRKLCPDLEPYLERVL